LMLFKGGQLVATKVGALSKAQLTAFIDQQLAWTTSRQPARTARVQRPGPVSRRCFFPVI